MLHSTLQQLRLFESVARNQSYTRAAEEIHLSQPAVSVQVKRLEEQIGMPLFEKMGKKIFLTRAGKELYDACQDIFNRMEQLESSLDDLRGTIAGPLSIGVVTTTKYFLPHLLGEFLRQYPAVEPHLKVSNRERILERFDNNRDDIYITGHAILEREAEDRPFLDDQLVVFANPDHPMARQKQITLEELSKERFLFREKGSGILQTLEAFLECHGVSLPPYMELGSGEAIKQAVMAGIGISMLSITSLKLELETGRLVVLDVFDLPIRRQWRAVHPKGKHLTPVAEKFIEFIEENAKQLIRR